MKGLGEKFTVHIRNSSMKIKIVAEMPNDINVSIAQDYENPFKMVSNATLNALAQRFAGQALTWDTSALYTWVGSTALQLTLDLDFVVDENSKSEMVDPVKQLIKLSVPMRGGTLRNLLPPTSKMSPTIVSIGQFLYLKDVIIISVAPTFTRPILGDGVPMRMPFTVVMQTRFIPCVQDIDEMFFGKKDAIS